MDVSINGESRPIANVEDLDRWIAGVADVDNLEIWVGSQDGPTICALLNSAMGWLMYQQDPMDFGRNSRSPDFDPGCTDLESYRLSNGQVDEYPKNWAIDRRSVFDALLDFCRTGEKPGSVHWGDDG